MTALVTGSAGGIGSAIVEKLRGEGFRVRELDLVNEGRPLVFYRGGYGRFEP